MTEKEKRALAHSLSLSNRSMDQSFFSIVAGASCVAAFPEFEPAGFTRVSSEAPVRGFFSCCSAPETARLTRVSSVAPVSTFRSARPAEVVRINTGSEEAGSLFSVCAKLLLAVMTAPNNRQARSVKIIAFMSFGLRSVADNQAAVHIALCVRLVVQCVGST